MTYLHSTGRRALLLSNGPPLADFHHVDHGAERTLELRIGSVFVVLAAGVLGGLPPMYIKVRDIRSWQQQHPSPPGAVVFHDRHVCFVAVLVCALHHYYHAC